MRWKILSMNAQNAVSVLTQNKNKVPCKCGCGAMIFEYDQRNRKRFYRFGHNGGHSFPRNQNLNSENKNTGYTRAKAVVPFRKSCELGHIGHCKGMLDLCHIDQDVMNNSRENLIVLCRCHHRLMDNGKIDLKNPVMPEFYTDGSGKRRYKK